MNIKELKDFIKDLPDDMEVVSCCSEDSTVKIVSDYPMSRCELVDGKYINIITQEAILWVGY